MLKFSLPSVLIFLLTSHVQLLAQDKLILSNLDSLNGKVIRTTTTSVIFKDNEGFEKEIPLKFLKSVKLSSGNKLNIRSYFYEPYKTPDSGRSEFFNHGSNLESEADALFYNAIKRKLPVAASNVDETMFNNGGKFSYEVNKTLELIKFHAFAVNAFLVLLSPSEIITYSNPINDISMTFGNTYILSYHKTVGSALEELEDKKLKPFTFKMTDGAIVDPSNEAKFTFEKGGKWTLINPKSPDISLPLDIVYTDAETFRYSLIKENKNHLTVSTKTMTLIK